METKLPSDSSKGQDTLLVVLSVIAVLGTVGFIFRKQIFAGLKAVSNVVTSTIGAGAKAVLTAAQEYFISDLNKTPGVQDKFRNFIEAARKKGWRTIITSGNRSFAEQAALKVQNSSNATPGLSAHNYGMAIDVNFENVETGQILRKATPKKEWIASGLPQLAKTMGLKWGGYDSEAEYKSSFAGYFDPVHFEIPINASALLTQAKKKYGNDVTKILGNELLIS